MEFEISSLPQQTTNQPQQIKMPEEETILQTGLRNLGRVGLRAAETVVGAPGDIASLGLGIGNYVSGGRIPTYEQIQEYTGSRLLPTSQQFKEENAEGAPWTAAQKGSWEETLDRGVETLTSLGLGGWAGGIKKAAAAVIGSELVGYAAKEIGASEGQQDVARIGTLLLSTLGGGRSTVRQRASQGYTAAEELAKGAQVASPKLSETVKKLGHYVESGSGKTADSKKWLSTHVQTLSDKLASGKIGVNDAIEFVRDIREDWSKIPNRARPKAMEIINSIKKDVISPYASKNKEFAKVWYPAEEAWSALHGNTVIGDTLEKISQHKAFDSYIGKSLFGYGSYKAIEKAAHIAPKLVAPAAGVMAAREGYRLVNLLRKSELARDTYYNLLKSSMAGNVAAASKYATKFDKLALNFEDNNLMDGDEFQITSL